MNPLVSAISRYFRRSQFARGKTCTNGRKARRTRPSLEALEDRLVLSPTISIANASMNEIGNVSTFVPTGSGGLSNPKDLVQGPDGNIYVASAGTNSVIRYSPTGQLLGTFVASGSGGFPIPMVWLLARTATSTWIARPITTSSNTVAAPEPSWARLSVRGPLGFRSQWEWSSARTAIST